MTPHRKRLTFILVGLAGIAIAVGLITNAFRGNLVFFVTPTEVAEGKAPKDQTFRLGGMVENGSLKRENDGLTVHFTVTDHARTVDVVFTGILPDMFTEGQGMVAQGTLGPDGVFRAKEVLAKHDETYMPPEVAEALEKGSQRKAAEAAVDDI